METFANGVLYFLLFIYALLAFLILSGSIISEMKDDSEEWMLYMKWATWLIKKSKSKEQFWTFFVVSIYFAPFAQLWVVVKKIGRWIYNLRCQGY